MQRIYVFTAMTVVLSAAVLLAQSDSDYHQMDCFRIAANQDLSAS